MWKTLKECISVDSEGWPGWIVETVNLPPLETETASKWFTVGWAMLRDVTRAAVQPISESAPAGNSNVPLWLRRCPKLMEDLYPVGEAGAKYRDNEKYSLNVQEQQRENLIQVRLRDAFMVRFGG